MAKLIFSGWFFYSFGVLLAQTVSIEEVHELFFRSESNLFVSSVLHKKLTSCPSVTPVLRAYKGISEAMQARNTFNVYKKYRLFLSGKDTLEKAVKEDKENFEIRFLRFQFQNNIPTFLGYNTMEEDKKFLLKNVTSYVNTSDDKEFTSKMLTVLAGSNYFSKPELRFFKQMVVYDKHHN